MRCLGLSFEGKNQKIAILSKVKNQVIIEKLEEQAEISATEKNLYKVSGLAPHEVVRREVSLKIKRQAALLQALPFQLETVLPFPSDEAVAAPFFHPKDGVTEIIVFAARKQSLEHHLQHTPLTPDQISCVPRALFQWARFVFPTEKFISFIYQNTAIAIDGDKIVFSQAFEDPQRLFDFMRSKFPTYFRVPEEGPAIQDIPYEKLLAFAIPIGLALEGLEKKSCQFLQSTTSPNWIQKKKNFIRQSFISSFALAGVVAAAGFSFFHLKERDLSRRIDAVFSSPHSNLEEKISQWQNHVAEEAKKLPALPDHPTAASTLAWIGNVDAPIDVVEFRYALVESGVESSIKIDIDFKAPNLPAAERFKEALEKNPTFIDKKQKIEWTATQDFYKISFFLRKI